MLWRLVACASIAPGIWWHQDDDGRLSVWSTENQRRALGVPAARHRMLTTHGFRRQSFPFPVLVDDVRRLAHEASGLLPPGLVEREGWRLTEGLRAATALLDRLRPVEVRTSSVEGPVLRGLVELAGSTGVVTTYMPHAPLTIYPESTDIPHRRIRTTFFEDLRLLQSIGYAADALAHEHRAVRPPTERTAPTIVSISPWGDRQIGRFLESVRVIIQAKCVGVAVSGHPRLTRRQSTLLTTSGMRVLREPLDNHLDSGEALHLITWSSAASRTALLRGVKVASLGIWPWRHYRFEYSAEVREVPLE